MLSDIDIKKAIAGGEITISPLSPDLIQPSSIDVRLFSKFLTFEQHGDAIDPAEEQRMVEINVDPHSPFMLMPGEFALASTYERLWLDRGIAARLEGKSSLGRLGLLTHATAGFIDPGFEGNVTLELSNLTRRPIKLWPGMKIGQLCFFRLDQEAEYPYGSREVGSHYQAQAGPTPSASFRNFTIDSVY